MFKLLKTFFVFSIAFVNSAPQQPEINDQFEVQNHTEVEEKVVQTTENFETNVTQQHTDNKTESLDNGLARKEEGFITKIYFSIKTPIVDFLTIPKVSSVLKNVATCIVNGAMELVTFYFPAPMIPLIASAAGMIMPFEPVVTLRSRMPVASYRRAFNAAVDSFVGTFDPYKKPVEDPYMTRRFNRRFLNDDGSSQIQIDSKGKDQ